MPIRYSNTKNTPLSLAVWLVEDTYDHNDDPWTISATEIIKPVRQIILGQRMAQRERTVDVADQVSSKMGSAIHDSIEQTWLNNYKQCLLDLGYPPGVIKRIVVNPEPGTDLTDLIPIYLEQRSHKKVGKWTVSGKFDFIGDGRLEDFKSTSTYTYINKTNDDKYILQGSIYRWLNPDKITQEQMAIQFIFTDWSAQQAMANKQYPQSKVLEYRLALRSVSEIEFYIRQKLALIEKYWDAPEDQIPECSDEDLWRGAPAFKYYTKPENKRAYRSFDNKAQAYALLAERGSGIVKEIPASVKACKYCPSFEICSQKNQYLADGSLKI